MLMMVGLICVDLSAFIKCLYIDATQMFYASQQALYMHLVMHKMIFLGSPEIYIFMW